jgi:hypothetical protein
MGRRPSPLLYRLTLDKEHPLQFAFTERLAEDAEREKRNEHEQQDDEACERFLKPAANEIAEGGNDRLVVEKADDHFLDNSQDHEQQQEYERLMKRRPDKRACTRRPTRRDWRRTLSYARSGKGGLELCDVENYLAQNFEDWLAQPSSVAPLSLANCPVILGSIGKAAPQRPPLIAKNSTPLKGSRLDSRKNLLSRSDSGCPFVPLRHEPTRPPTDRLAAIQRHR